MHKKAQASVFMIIAMVIILVGALYFYSLRVSIRPGDIVQPEIRPIQAFVEGCIDQTTTDAATILGLNGGYLNFPLGLESNPNSYLKGPISNIKNPYWWYNGIDAVPTEDFMIEQLEDRVTNKLRSCLNNFEAFEEFKVEESGELKTNIVLTSTDIEVRVDYPIDVQKLDDKTRFKFDSFSKTVPIRLKKTYEFAKKIMETENRDDFIERKAIDLISMDEDIPTTDIEATCDEKAWVFNKVKNKLKKLLRVNLPYIRVKGSNYLDNIYVSNPFGEDTYQDSYYQSHYVWQVSDETFPEFSAAFIFNENWPFDMEARPRDGHLLRSNKQQGFSFLNFVCLHIWHFSYDVNFPVKVTVSETNEKFRPYAFSFAFKASIDHNEPNKASRGTTIFETSDRPENQEFCNDISNEISIFTVSSTSDQELDLAGVNLSMSCGPYTCKLGRAGWLSEGAAAGIIKKVPYCVSAVLRGRKEGHLDGQMFIQTDTSTSYTLQMQPIIIFNNYSVVKHDLDNPGIKKNLEKGEKASIQLKQTGGTLETFGFYPTDGDFPITLLDDAATYEVTIYLADDEDIIGGYQQNWTISREDFAGKKEIAFHVLYQGSAAEEEQALFIAGLDSYSKTIPVPELK